MSDVKQVKVDNWGIYFLQRLKHFFNRTDYCDLTLQFQDNAQLKVHRLVLSACTEYFELLERTCEMYEDCLVMPDDLQADVVVPIVNFMYTGQLEFKVDMLEKLYQTSLVMNMPVLSKLLEAHRPRSIKSVNANHSYSPHKKPIRSEVGKHPRLLTPPPILRTPSTTTKRSYSKAFSSNATPKEKPAASSTHQSVTSPSSSFSRTARSVSPVPVNSVNSQQSKKYFVDPRPTRYELPDELDTDNVFENSFCNISYTCSPLMVHPETTKHYPSKKSNLFYDRSDPKRMLNKTSTMDIVECRKITKNDNIFDDISESVNDEAELFQSNYANLKDESPKDSSQLFDQILDANGGPKVTIEAKDSKQVNTIDHAKIISEVLKKYPHLVKSNKNIKLKILNTTTKTKKPRYMTSTTEEKEVKTKDYTYETDVLDSKEAAKLIAMGAENIKGPWICLICGTPGRALHFTSYYKFRRHLVEVHNEKPVSTICEYCGFRSFKRNYMLYHCFTKHGVEPPPQYKFPKCNMCDYVAITEGVLVRHKMSAHQSQKTFGCNVCSQSFSTTSQLLKHIQKTAHKFCAERKNNLQCIYCLKIFLRETNLYNHLRTTHKGLAKRDGIIHDSDDERQKVNDVIKTESVKYEIPIHYDTENDDGVLKYVVSEKPQCSTSSFKQKILNPGFSTPAKIQKTKPARKPSIHNELEQESLIMSSSDTINQENIVIIDDNEYIMKGNQLIPRKVKTREKEYTITDIVDQDNHSMEEITPSTSMQYSMHNADTMHQTKMILKKANINQPIQIVVSNEEEYKALMSSNHSIIFDDGDSNKTLTVMTTSHNTTLDTGTIDLDNAQSNEMMILPDDYPINVSEATDNSNIVVVYSHQVGHVEDDPNKQYQIISSQDIGAQYVQSSAIITQNFETVTTSTPVMSAHVIDAEVDDCWQNSQEQIPPEVQIQTIPIKGETEPLIELPEVQLIHQVKTIPSQISEIPENLNQSDIMHMTELGQHSSNQVVKELGNVSVTSVDVNIPCETIITKEIGTSKTVDNTNQEVMNVTPESHNIIQSVIQEQEDEISYQDEKGDYQKMVEESEETIEPEISETPVEQQPADEQITACIDKHKTSHEADNISHEADNISQETHNLISNNNQEILSNVTSLPIQNLTSEWSEDEYEITAQDASNADDVKSTDEITSPNSANSPEIEESIENIQQEMEKQMASDNVLEKNQDSQKESSSVPIEEVEEQLTNIVPTPVEIVPVQEKLSSLLNDWDDNDSQEEDNNTTNEDEQENVDTTEENIDTAKENINTIGENVNGAGENVELTGENVHATEENLNMAAEIVDTGDRPPEPMSNAHSEHISAVEDPDPKEGPKRDDNIKSLVSDWDDDEDESKE